MSTTIAVCPKCNSSRQVERVGKPDPLEIYPIFTENGKKNSPPRLKTKFSFRCTACNYTFRAKGQTWKESTGMFKIG